MANDIKVAISLEGKDALNTIKALEKGVKGLGKTGEKSIGGMTGAVQVFQGVVGAQVLLRSIDLIGRTLQKSAKDALVFGKAIAEINSIAPRTATETLALKQQLIGLSNEFAGPAQKQAKAFYNIVSAGVQGTAKQLNVLETANKAAVAGLVDIDTSARVLVSSVNSYAVSGLTATQASDILFTTVKEGITTFGELSGSLGTVAPLASAAGLKFSELGGTLAFLTKSGISTAEATTGLRAILTGVIKPSEEAAKFAKQLGLEFNTSSIKAKGFAGFMKEVIEKTGGTETALAKLFPNVRALGPVIQLANGNFEDFVRILKETEDASGATEAAFKTITASAGFQFEKLTNQLTNFPTAILTNFEEPIADALKSINEFVGTQGILLIADAVDTIISSFDDMQVGVSNVKVGLAAVASGAAELGVQWTELALAVNQAIQSTSRFIGLDTSSALKEEEVALKSRIAGLKEFQAAQEEGALAELAAAEKTSKGVAEFRAKIEAGRKAQVASEDARREEEITKDKEVAEAKLEANLEAENTKFDALQELKTAQKELEFEQAEEEKLAKELEGEEEFQRLTAALGREAVARDLHRISQIENEAKRIAEIKKLNDKAEASAAKKAKLNADADIRLTRQTTQAKLNIVGSSLALAEALTGKSNKAIFFAQKALSIAQIIVAGQTAQAAALAPPPLGAGPLAGIPLAGLIQANTVLQVATVAATSAGSFQSGGIIDGASQTGDQLTANVNGGEAIFNRRQQQNLFNAVDSGALGGGGGTTNITIESPTGDMPQETIDNLIDQLNDRQEFGNRTLGAA